MHAPAGEPIATYDYVGPNGDGLLYQKVKYLLPGGDKTFRQRRPRGGGWDWKLGDVPRVLYRLPQLLAADPDDVVFYVEGEKDADRLAELGLVATTAGGAADWRPEMARSLRGRDVVILPDNDVPGRKHAAVVARDVHEVAVRVRLLDLPGLPEKGDVSDWLDAGHDIEELLTLVGGAGAWEPPVNGHDHHNGNGANGTGLAKRVVTWLDRAAIVALIRSRADEAWVDIGLGNDTITRIRAGGLVTLSGPSGAGKSSLAAGFAMRHASEVGWVLILSRELTTDEMGARMIGAALGRSWEEVLRGQVTDEEMLRALPERVRIIDRDDATLTTLDDELGRLRETHPNEPILSVVDYGQIIAEDSDDQRVRTSGAWALFDSILRRRRAVGLMLSQMSRANSKAARAGERLGADALDGGAESAAIERYSTVVLEIGATGPEDEHGRREMLLSVGKGRMGGGDRVWPISFEGRTGRVAVIGLAKAADEVRAEREAHQSDAKTGLMVRALRDALTEVKKPISRSDLCELAGVNKKKGLGAIRRMLMNGDLVEVRVKPPRAKAWLLWTRNQAEAHRIEIVVEEEGGNAVQQEGVADAS
jgi:hypothetical protein